MANKIICIVLYLCVVISVTVAGVETVNSKIKITVGTTAGCSDARRFISTQLVQAYELYGQFLDLEFVPWARTRREMDGTLSCQFGPNDCWANQLQRCALHLLKTNQDAQLQYMNCEFTNPFPAISQNSYHCTEVVGLSRVEVDNCISTNSEALGIIAEEASLLPMQIINFVPFITFNDVIDASIQNQARTGLTTLLCLALEADPSTGVTNCYN